MDFRELDPGAGFSDAAREWVEANVPPEWVAEQHRSGTYQTPELHHLLARDGFLGAGWPAEYGGSAVDPMFTRAVFDELYRRGMHMDGWGSTCIVLRTIEQVGTEAQKHQYIGGAMRGEILIALGYSEPDSGSDVASAKTTAVRDGGEWVISGQKMFTSSAHVCSHIFLLARTNPDVPKHQGLSLFLVPTDSPGLEIRPIHTLGGQRTNATFYSDVRIPDSARVGAIDEGWSVMRVALVFERGVSSPASPRYSRADELARWALETRRADGSAPLDDPLTASRIARIAIDEEVTRLLRLRVRRMVQKGQLPGVEGSMQKLFASETAQRGCNETLEILGAEGLLAPEATDAPNGGAFEAAFRASAVITIYGGSSEVQREIIAERRLGLPRNRPRR